MINMPRAVHIPRVSGWWFNECDKSNLNGHYGINSEAGVEWQLWVESPYTLKKAEMKIKPLI
jgi:hypothetical protein